LAGKRVATKSDKAISQKQRLDARRTQTWTYVREESSK